MKSDIKLSVFHEGKLAQKPVFLTIFDLRETLLIASDFDESKANDICKTIEEFGRCSLGFDDGMSSFEFEKIMAS